jgi:DHA1 family bicyclomycin/chloramphenicol resistance-like MFS transporter
MLGGLCGSSLAGLALIVILGLRIPYLAVVVVPCFLMMVSLGFVGPNASSLALTPHPEAAGTGAAILGFSQFTAGAVVAPIVGIAGTTSALPMAVLMAAGPLLALGIWRLSPSASEPEHVLLEAMLEPPPL